MNKFTSFDERMKSAEKLLEEINKSPKEFLTIKTLVYNEVEKREKIYRRKTYLTLSSRIDKFFEFVGGTTEIDISQP